MSASHGFDPHSGDSLPDLADGFRLAHCEVDPRTNRVSRDGETFSVEPKVMQVLLLLATYAGEPVTRDRIMETVWADVIVTDDTLTRCVSEARKVFDRPAGNPETSPREGGSRATNRNSIIETIPRVGYRLVEPVEPLPRRRRIYQPPSFSVRKPEPATAPISGSISWRVAGFLGLALIATAVVFRVQGRQNRGEASVGAPTPLTSLPGREMQASYSPVDDRVAFLHAPDSGGSVRLMTVREGDPTPFEVLESTPGSIGAPAWSPDGQTLLFTRVDSVGCSIHSVPALGGPVSPVTACTGSFVQFDLSPDGSLLAMDGQAATDEPVRIDLVDLESGEKTRIQNDAPLTHDYAPKFSRDGTSVLFSRSLGEGEADLFLYDIDAGTTRRLSEREESIIGFDWSGEGRSSLFSSGMGGRFELKSLDHRTGEVRSLGLRGLRPSVERTGSRVVYESMQIDSDLAVFRGDVGSTACASTRYDRFPALSPDGRSVVFVSDRNGPTGLYRCDLDGDVLEVLPVSGFQMLLNPAIGPDGRIVFAALLDGEVNIYVLDDPTAEPRQLTAAGSNDMYPFFSPDGRWIYYSSDREGRMDIWRTPPGGTTTERVTHESGLVGMVSGDGAWLYFQKAPEPGLWRMRLPVELSGSAASAGTASGTGSAARAATNSPPDSPSGSQPDSPTNSGPASAFNPWPTPELIDPDLTTSDLLNWKPHRDGVLLARSAPQGLITLHFLDPDTGEKTLLRSLPAGRLSSGFAATEDLSVLVATVIDRVDADLMTATLPSNNR